MLGVCARGRRKNFRSGPRIFQPAGVSGVRKEQTVVKTRRRAKKLAGRVCRAPVGGVDRAEQAWTFFGAMVRIFGGGEIRALRRIQWNSRNTRPCTKIRPANVGRLPRADRNTAVLGWKFFGGPREFR